MKKIILMLILSSLLLSGCAKENTETKETDTTSSSQSKTEEKAEEKNEVKENTSNSVKDSEGNAVTSENLAEMIDKANDENTDEATKREILDEIDYILKQAEKNAQ